ncbi:MAG: hypothetical protein KF760_03095 [Candidatus Eremiobacteraeota bacterium]|nr:hypothetical protein [Candidatus Eremiobacteraeota bacterium]
MGQRKNRPTGLEKPPAFVRQERREKPAPSEPAPPAKPAPKPRAQSTSRAPKKPPAVKAKAPDAATFQALVEEVARLSQALATQPTWADLKALEERLLPGDSAPSAGSQLEDLQELLRTREEELEELGLVVSEFQEQNEQAHAQIQELTRRLREAQAETVQAEIRQQLAEGFLREALLSLLAPGDEFNEDLVEQIQHFLQP